MSASAKPQAPAVQKRWRWVRSDLLPSSLQGRSSLGVTMAPVARKAMASTMPLLWIVA